MSDKKKYILIASVCVVILLALVLLPIFFGSSPDSPTDTESAASSSPTPTPTTKPTPTTIKIDKLSELADNLPDARIKLIEENLFETITLNVSGEAKNNVSDAVVRESSFKQTLEDSNKQITFTTFLVDIPSLKQSYRVNDYHSPLPAEMSGLRDYATLVLCPERSELIYDAFTCTDRIKQEQGI